MPLESTEITQDQLLNYQLMFPIGQDKSIPWNSITAYENMKAKRISELKKLKEQVGFLCKTFSLALLKFLAATLKYQYFGQLANQLLECSHQMLEEQTKCQEP